MSLDADTSTSEYNIESFEEPFTGFTTRCSSVEIKVPFAGFVHPAGGDGIHAGHSRMPATLAIGAEHARHSSAKQHVDKVIRPCFMAQVHPAIRILVNILGD